DRERCGAGQLALHLEAADEAGARGAADRCLPIDRAATLLLRTDHALYASGAPIAVEVRSAAPEGVVFLDVVKEGQTVATTQARRVRGEAHVPLPGDPARFGTLALRAYRIGPDGAQSHDAKLVYVERPGALSVEVRPDQASYQPGTRGRIHLHVAGPDPAGA